MTAYARLLAASPLMAAALVLAVGQVLATAAAETVAGVGGAR